MIKALHKFAVWVSDVAGHPLALVAASVVCLIWFWAERGAFDWLDLISALTFWMVFAIQHTQNANETALHAKIDELIRAHPEADDSLRGIERHDDGA